MTDKEILIAFRSEVERLKDSCASPIVICDTLLFFIDSMQEEHINYDKLNTMLDDALAKETTESWNEWLGEESKPKFKAGDHIRPIDSSLGASRTILEICDGWYVTNQGILDFEYEDNWKLVREPVSEELEKEIEQYEESFRHKSTQMGYKETACHFANWQKQYMMKDAFSFTIMKAQYCDEHLPPLKDLATLPLIRFSPRELLERGLKVGDKVKVVIIKED